MAWGTDLAQLLKYRVQHFLHSKTTGGGGHLGPLPRLAPCCARHSEILHGSRRMCRLGLGRRGGWGCGGCVQPTVTPDSALHFSFGCWQAHALSHHHRVSHQQDDHDPTNLCTSCSRIRS